MSHHIPADQIKKAKEVERQRQRAILLDEKKRLQDIENRVRETSEYRFPQVKVDLKQQDEERQLLLLRTRILKAENDEQERKAREKAAREAQEEEDYFRLLGIVAPCCLDGHDVHTLTGSHDIDEHYTHQRRLPGFLERARPHVRTGKYAFVLVYKKRLVGVTPDGCECGILD
jgi:hypothetical protein